MPRPPTPSACCTVLALGLALACGDTGAPVGPKQLLIAAGDSQSASLGTPLSTPLKVRVIGTDNQPLPGIVVTWTVTQGVAAPQPVASVTDVTGEATTSLVLGLQTGPVQVTASVPGVAPVVFTATVVVVYTFPCQAVTPYVAFAVLGTLDAGDCTIDGYYLDVLSLILPSQRSLALRMTGTFDTWVGFYAGDGAFLAMNDDTLLGVAHNSMLNVIVAAGSYLITPTAFGPGTMGDYTLTVYDRPTLLSGCDADVAYLSYMDPAQHYAGSDRSAVWLTRGVSFPESLTPGDCADSTGPYYSDRAFIWLDSGSVLTVREASSDFDAYVTLFGPNGFVAFNDDSANAPATTNAYLVVQAPVSAAFLLDFGTRDTATAGNYTISIAGAGGLNSTAVMLGAPRVLASPRAWKH